MEGPKVLNEAREAQSAADTGGLGTRPTAVATRPHPIKGSGGYDPPKNPTFKPRIFCFFCTLKWSHMQRR